MGFLNASVIASGAQRYRISFHRCTSSNRTKPGSAPINLDNLVRVTFLMLIIKQLHKDFIMSAAVDYISF